LQIGEKCKKIDEYSLSNGIVLGSNMSDQLKVFSRLAVEQLMDVLKDVLAKEPVPAVQATVLQDLMPDNIVEKVWNAILNEPSVQEVKISIAHLKTFAYDLPFMPDRIDYKIGTCCDEIVYNRGLFTPCSKACKEGTKCRAHLVPSGFGDFQSRLTQWDDGNGIGKMQVTPETDPTRVKAFKEVTYGEFCQKSKISEDIVNKALREANFMLSVDRRNFVVPVKSRKVRGRPAKKLVEEVEDVHEDVSLDAEDEKSEVKHVEGWETRPSEESEPEELKDEDKDDEDEVEVKPRPARPLPRIKKPKATDGEKPKPKPRAKKVKEVEGTPLDGHLKAEEFEEEHSEEE